MKPKKKLIFRIILTLLAAALSPVVVANIWGHLYGRLVQGRGGAMADFIVGWVAGFWIGGVILIVGLVFCFINQKK